MSPEQNQQKRLVRDLVVIWTVNGFMAGFLFGLFVGVFGD